MKTQVCTWQLKKIIENIEKEYQSLTAEIAENVDKVITIQEAIKEMDSGNTGKCLSNGLFYRKSNDVAGIHYYEMSASPDFSHIERVQCKWFDSLEIFSEWEIIVASNVANLGKSDTYCPCGDICNLT